MQNMITMSRLFLCLFIFVFFRQKEAETLFICVEKYIKMYLYTWVLIALNG